MSTLVSENTDRGSRSLPRLPAHSVVLDGDRCRIESRFDYTGKATFGVVAIRVHALDPAGRELAVYSLPPRTTAELSPEIVAVIAEAKRRAVPHSTVPNRYTIDSNCTASLLAQLSHLASDHHGDGSQGMDEGESLWAQEATLPSRSVHYQSDDLRTANPPEVISRERINGSAVAQREVRLWRETPQFERFAESRLALDSKFHFEDRTFLSQEKVHETTEVTFRIDQAARRVYVQTHVTNDNSEGRDTRIAIPFLNPLEIPSGGAPETEALKVMWQAMECYWRYGLDGLQFFCQSGGATPTSTTQIDGENDFGSLTHSHGPVGQYLTDERDRNILNGDPLNDPDMSFVLPGGAEITLNVGTEFSSIRVGAQPNDGAASLWWAFRHDLSDRASQNAQIGSLQRLARVLGAPLQNDEAVIAAINELNTSCLGGHFEPAVDPSEEWSEEAEGEDKLRQVVHHKAAETVELVLSHEIAAELSSLENIEVSTLPPHRQLPIFDLATEVERDTSVRQVLELLGGRQHIRINFTEEAKLNLPKDVFVTMLLAAAPDGSCKISCENGFGHYFRAYLPASPPSTYDGTCFEPLVEIIRLFSQQSSDGRMHFQLHLEGLDESSPHASFDPSPQLACSSNPWSNWAYSLAGQLLLTAETMRLQDHPTLVVPQSPTPTRSGYELAFSTAGDYEMKILLDDEGVHRVEVQSFNSVDEDTPQDTVLVGQQTLSSAHPISSINMCRHVLSMFDSLDREQRLAWERGETFSLSNSRLADYLRMCFGGKAVNEFALARIAPAWNG